MRSFRLDKLDVEHVHGWMEAQAEAVEAEEIAAKTGNNALGTPSDRLALNLSGAQKSSVSTGGQGCSTIVPPVLAATAQVDAQATVRRLCRPPCSRWRRCAASTISQTSDGRLTTCSTARSSASIRRSASARACSQSSSPSHSPSPSRTTGKCADSRRLDQRQRLEQLVQRAVAARRDHEGAGVADEHHLAGEEVAEAKPDVEIGVRRLLARELDVAADRQRTGVARAAVGGLHQPGPPPVMTA